MIDATASLTEHYPFWIFHGRKKALIFGRESVDLDLQNGMGVLTMADTGRPDFRAWTRICVRRGQNEDRFAASTPNINAKNGGT